MNIHRNIIRGVMTGVVVLLYTTANAAELRFSRHFSDHMVLQRDKPALIRGFADPGAEITVVFAKQKQVTRADKEGEWTVTLKAMPANSKGSILTATVGERSVSLENIVVGDVFLFARQTSIDISLGRDKSGVDAAANIEPGAAFRVLGIKTIPAKQPLHDLAPEATTGWAVVEKEVALGMSAAAFHFAQDISREAEVPVGIVDLNMGHHFPMSWMPREALLETGALYGRKMHGDEPVETIIKVMDTQAADYESGKTKAWLDEEYGKYADRAIKSGWPKPPRPPLWAHPVNDPRFPAAGYNAVLHPLRGMAFRAVLLQLGNDYPYDPYRSLFRQGQPHEESLLQQAYRATYEQRKGAIYTEPITLPRIPSQWRAALGDTDLPFGLIMPPASDLIPMAMHHIEMRELQRRIAVDNERVGLVMPGNQHIRFSAQPADEKLLAKRCVKWVQGAIEEKDGIPPSGPMFARMDARYSRARVFFRDGTANGLQASGDALSHFEVAGEDGEFVPATATIDGATIRLTCKAVTKIVFARYNWRLQPDQGLVNSAGLPAIPFRTDDHSYPTTIMYAEENLPEEFFTPASEWKSRAMTIVNGRLKAGGGDFSTFGEGYLGATGIRVGRFGPNLSVIFIHPGSPADGKILPGDAIYEVNGKLLTETPMRQVGAALTHAESEAGGGKIAFGLRRDGENLTVVLTLEVLGTYSATSPYDCPKVDRIVELQEKFLAERGGLVPGLVSPYVDYDAIYLLGAGTPAYQGLVRRNIYAKMARTDKELLRQPIKNPDQLPAPKRSNWVLASDALLAGEYFLATGDRNVLPFLHLTCNYLAKAQVKMPPDGQPWGPGFAGERGSWYHNYIPYGRVGYSPLPAIATQAMLGFQLAVESGVPVDQAAYQRGLDHLLFNGIKVGRTWYGSRTEPVTEAIPVDPEKMATGMLHSDQGCLALAAVFYKLRGDNDIAHLGSLISAYSYNNTHYGHGYNFGNICWTPLGANVQGKKAFIHFMKGNSWYRDLSRLYNHSVFGRKPNEPTIGMRLGLLVPRQRLRMAGAEPSVFSKNVEVAFLKPALAAHAQRDYVACEKLVGKSLESKLLTIAERAQAEQLLNKVKTIRESIDLDLTKVETLIETGMVYEAQLDLPQLKGVVAPDNERLRAIERKLTQPGVKPALKADQKRYARLRETLAFNKLAGSEETANKAPWIPLTPLFDPATQTGQTWRIQILESISQAPEDWIKPEFDDRDWARITLPTSFAINHTALLRTEFDIADMANVGALRLNMNAFNQKDVVIYINGVVVAKLVGAGNSRDLKAPLKAGAIQALRKGGNTLAIKFRHHWRWGPYLKNYYCVQGVHAGLEMRNVKKKNEVENRGNR